MTAFWCSWCGTTAEGESEDERISCLRCLLEFSALLGFPPVTSMTPLKPGEKPGEPAAATKRFTFTEPGTGRVLGRTMGPRRDQRRAG